MNILLKILILLAVNALGFWGISLCYLMGVALGLIDLTNSEFDAHAFQAYFVHGSYMTWFVCAVFSLAYLFLKGKERYLFLLAPLIIPFGYGLSVIFDL
jgi:hypothetical protein